MRVADGKYKHLKVWVVGRNAVIREGLRAIFLRRGWQVEAYARAPRAPVRPAASRADVIVVDLSSRAIPPSEVEALGQAHGARSVLLGFVVGREAGRIACLDAKRTSHAVDAQVVVRVIRGALEHAGHRISAPPRARSAERLVAATATLTTREQEIFRLLAEGKPNSQIAHELGISVKTVETHKEHLKEKLGSRSTVELMAMAIQSMKREQKA